jgi:hypothetical protein
LGIFIISVNQKTTTNNKKGENNMIIDFDVKIKNLEGLPLKMDNQELTLKFCAITALFGQYNDGFDQDVKEKKHRFKLAQMINSFGRVDVSKHDVEKIKTLIGKAFSTLVMGSAIELLDQAMEDAIHDEATEARVFE